MFVVFALGVRATARAGKVFVLTSVRQVHLDLQMLPKNKGNPAMARLVKNPPT